MEAEIKNLLRMFRAADESPQKLKDRDREEELDARVRLILAEIKRA